METAKNHCIWRFNSGYLLLFLLLSIMWMIPAAGLARPGIATGTVNDSLAGETISRVTGSTGEDAVFGSEEQPLQGRNLNAQRVSSGFRSVVSSDDAERFADYTVMDALIRVPGIQADRRGNINIRGVGHDRYNVTINGMRAVTTETQHRSFEPGGISTDMVRDIEVIKVITPDMDADALAGTINLVTGPLPGEPQIFDVRLGGGYNTRYDNSPGIRGALNYSAAVREDLSLAINLSRFSDYRGLETLEVVYDTADFGSGPVDVMERLSPGLQIDQNQMLGSTFQLNFQPSEQAVFYLQGMINWNNREQVSHRNSRSAIGIWVDQDLTGEQGEYRYDMRVRDVALQQYAFRTGARHEFELLDMEYNAGWVLNNRNQTDLLFPFRADRVEYAVNMDDRNRPSMQVNNFPNLSEGSIRSEQMLMQNLERVIDDRKENMFSGNISLDIPVGFATLSMGSSASLTSKKRVFKDMNFRYRPLSLGTFSLQRGSGIHILDQEQYAMPGLIEVSDARVFFANSYPSFRLNNDMYRERSETGNYLASEQIYAGYTMATVERGILTLIGGARVEHENSQIDARRVLFGQAGLFSEAADTSLTAGNTHLFPHAQLLLSPGSVTHIRLAYSKTIARPGFMQRAPFELSNLLNVTLYRGNPDLQPMTSDNLDLMTEFYIANNGILSVGLFHKNLSNFIYLREQIIEITEGDVRSYDPVFRNNEELTTLPVQERSFQNGDETATISGLEISWQQRLAYLPGFLGNFGIYSNYTFSHSVFDVDYREEEVSLPGHSPHVVNAAIDYSQGRFSGRVSYHWTAEALSELYAATIHAPSLDSGNIYPDRYEDGWSDMSASVQFRIMDNFRLWANVTNLLGGHDRLQYIQSREYYPSGIDHRGGRYFQLGLMYNL